MCLERIRITRSTLAHPGGGMAAYSSSPHKAKFKNTDFADMVIDIKGFT
jgi:hypothetical protein